jgi:hypothetical protein
MTPTVSKGTTIKQGNDSDFYNPTDPALISNMRTYARFNQQVLKNGEFHKIVSLGNDTPASIALLLKQELDKSASTPEKKELLEKSLYGQSLKDFREAIKDLPEAERKNNETKFVTNFNEDQIKGAIKLLEKETVLTAIEAKAFTDRIDIAGALKGVATTGQFDEPTRQALLLAYSRTYESNGTIKPSVLTAYKAKYGQDMPESTKEQLERRILQPLKIYDALDKLPDNTKEQIIEKMARSPSTVFFNAADVKVLYADNAKPTPAPTTPDFDLVKEEMGLSGNTDLLATADTGPAPALHQQQPLINLAGKPV